MKIPFYTDWKAKNDRRKKRHSRRLEVMAKVEEVCDQSARTIHQLTGGITIRPRDSDVTIP